jgi:hypothetical protein
MVTGAMPLVARDHYSLREALDIVRDWAPDEDALENLLDALHRGKVEAWILDKEFGGREYVPAHRWRSATLLFGYSLETGHGHLYIGDPYVATRTVRGPVQIDKDALDTLLRASPKAPTSMSEPRCRRWLEQEISDGHRRRFEECQAEAIKRFDVSKKGFRRVWDATVPPGWKKGGAPRKTSQ